MTKLEEILLGCHLYIKRELVQKVTLSSTSFPPLLIFKVTVSPGLCSEISEGKELSSSIFLSL